MSSRVCVSPAVDFQLQLLRLNPDSEHVVRRCIQNYSLAGKQNIIEALKYLLFRIHNALKRLFCGTSDWQRANRAICEKLVSASETLRNRLKVMYGEKEYLVLKVDSLMQMLLKNQDRHQPIDPFVLNNLEKIVSYHNIDAMVKRGIHPEEQEGRRDPISSADWHFLPKDMREILHFPEENFKRTMCTCTCSPAF